MTRSLWLMVVLYGLILLGLVTVLVTVRRQTLASFDTPHARDEWETWRLEAGKQDGITTSVERRVPVSSSPPTLVLLRDYFGICVVVAVTLSSALYWSIALMVRGVLMGPRFEVEPDHD